VRLSNTWLTAADLHDKPLRREEYLGSTDPTTEPLAIWGGHDVTAATLIIRDCFGIEVRGLIIQHGEAPILSSYRARGEGGRAAARARR